MRSVIHYKILFYLILSLPFEVLCTFPFLFKSVSSITLYNSLLSPSGSSMGYASYGSLMGHASLSAGLDYLYRSKA